MDDLNQKTAEEELKKGYKDAEELLNNQDKMEEFLQKLEKKLQLLQKCFLHRPIADELDVGMGGTFDEGDLRFVHRIMKETFIETSHRFDIHSHRLVAQHTCHSLAAMA